MAKIPRRHRGDYEPLPGESVSYEQYEALKQRSAATIATLQQRLDSTRETLGALQDQYAQGPHPEQLKQRAAEADRRTQALRVELRDTQQEVDELTTFKARIPDVLREVAEIYGPYLIDDLFVRLGLGPGSELDVAVPVKARLWVYGRIVVKPPVTGEAVRQAIRDAEFDDFWEPIVNGDSWQLGGYSRIFDG